VEEPLRIIGDGHELPDAPVPEGLEGKDLIELYRWVVFLRTLDERAVALNRQGRIGPWPIFSGEEGTQAGALFACEDEDWVFPTYRQAGVGAIRGVPLVTILGWARGYGGPDAWYDPRRYRVGPICAPVGTHLPHAVGVGWAARIAGERLACLAWFGDGATSEGDFHEALNFASVFRAPVVFFCVNNQWAISTPVSRQMATDTVAVKAQAYGVPGVRVDGFDPLACWKAARGALERARAGEGPTLIEAFCYRLGPHATPDDPSLYRDPAEAERWRPFEPVERMGWFLRRLGMADDADLEALAEEARERVTAAVRELEAKPPPGPGVLFDHVYAGSRPWTLSLGLEELLAARERADPGPEAQAHPGERGEEP
jgi:pyruvate dehydrogenase E1 component alpha subunit